MAPRAAPDMHGHQPRREGRLDVVVDPVADVGDLTGGDTGLFHQPLEEARGRLLDTPPGGRADQVDVLAQKLLRLGRGVADRPDEQAS